MKRVIVESPFAGNEKINKIYGAFAMHDCLVNHDESPYASHLLYTQKYVLRDYISSERKLGIDAGFEWRKVADKTIFYVDLLMTNGMQEGLHDCRMKELPYEVRKLPPSLWKRFLDAMENEGIEVIRAKKK